MEKRARRAVRGSARGRQRSASGAAAVEFALVSAILFLVLFGIIQYGLYFNDSLNARQGVREAARLGVVKNFTGGTGTTDMEKLKDITATQVDALTGTTYVMVKPSSPWKKGSALTVCAMVNSDGAVGLLPMPNGGWIESKTQMSIEQDTPAASGSTTSDTLPAGSPGWGWC
jgi:Flp pilus assembly protein TadG